MWTEVRLKNAFNLGSGKESRTFVSSSNSILPDTRSGFSRRMMSPGLGTLTEA